MGQKSGATIIQKLLGLLLKNDVRILNFIILISSVNNWILNLRLYMFKFLNKNMLLNISSVSTCYCNGT